MAGMCDNPLVGDYSKGISKGPAYFRALDLRIRREKYNPKRLVSDLEMGLIRDQKARVALSVSLTGLGRFGPKTQVLGVVKPTSFKTKVPKKRAPKLALPERLLLLQKHFCG